MYQVKAYWDADARMWRGDSPDVPGLAVHAATMEDLVEDVRDRIQDLMPPGAWTTSREPIAINIIASRSEHVARRH